MRKLLLIMFMLTSMSTFAQKNNRPEVGSICKVYSGSEGLMITTTRLGDEATNEALVKFSGIDHPWNNKIFKAKLTKTKSNSLSNNVNMSYEIEWKGKKYRVLAGDGDAPGYFTAYILPYGSQQVEHRLSYNKDHSAYSNAEHLLTEYLEQK